MEELKMKKEKKTAPQQLNLNIWSVSNTGSRSHTWTRDIACQIVIAPIGLELTAGTWGHVA